jgi:DNA helicase HerA-like ATPase
MKNNQLQMKKLSNDMLAESVLKIGSVYEVKGNKIIIKVDKEKNAPHLVFNGEIIKNVSVGSYIKITKGFNEIIGKIEGEYISDDKNISQSEYKSFKDKIKRFLNVTLVGFIEENGFKQGLKELPLIENDCYLLTQVEFELIHSFAKEDDDLITIGSLLNETSVNIKLGVDKLFASHIGIFGNTGSGKSYTLAKIYHELFKQFKRSEKFQQNAKFLIIDFNGEYVNPKLQDSSFDKIIVEDEYKDEYVLPVRKFPLSKESIENVEILSILLDATEKTQKPYLDSVLNYNLFKEDRFLFTDFIKTEIIEILLLKKDKNLGVRVLFELFKDINDCFDELDSNYKEIRQFIASEIDYRTDDGSFYLKKGMDSRSNKYSSTDSKGYKEENINFYFKIPLFELIDKIKFQNDKLFELKLKIILKYYKDYISGNINPEFIGPLKARTIKIFRHLFKLVEVTENTLDTEKNITILSLKNVTEQSIKKVLSLVIYKEFYDSHKKFNNKSKFLNIIIDEAHNILSKNSIRESETWKDYRLETFEEIIKEGRKFGVFLTIASQRPSDISDTIISQLHNYFLHRLINNKDIEAIGRTVSYLDKVSFDSLSTLPQGACILAGLSADLPVVIKIDEITEGYRPYNETIELTKHWK